jgi:hypothetical protein
MEAHNEGGGITMPATLRSDSFFRLSRKAQIFYVYAVGGGGARFDAECAMAIDEAPGNSLFRHEETAPEIDEDERLTAQDRCMHIWDENDWCVKCGADGRG